VQVPGKPFFSDAGFAFNQNRDIGARDWPRFSLQLSHRVTAAEEEVHRTTALTHFSFHASWKPYQGVFYQKQGHLGRFLAHKVKKWR
jgi:hypothetical protein